MNSKLKEYRLPQIHLDILLTELNKLYENNNDRTFTKEKMIEDIKASRTSSSVPAKIFELKQFGLLEGGNQTLHITELGRKIFQVGDNQRSIEIGKAIKNIKLWDLIQSIGGKDYTDTQLFEILIKNGRVKDQELKQMLPKIRQGFLRDVACITQFRPKTSHTISQEPPKKAQLIRMPSIILPHLIPKTQKNDEDVPNDKIKMSIQFGTRVVDIEDELTFRFAQQTMNAIQKELIKRGFEFDAI